MRRPFILLGLFVSRAAWAGCEVGAGETFKTIAAALDAGCTDVTVTSTYDPAASGERTLTIGDRAVTLTGEVSGSGYPDLPALDIYGSDVTIAQLTVGNGGGATGILAGIEALSSTLVLTDVDLVEGIGPGLVAADCDVTLTRATATGFTTHPVVAVGDEGDVSRTLALYDVSFSYNAVDTVYGIGTVYAAGTDLIVSGGAFVGNQAAIGPDLTVVGPGTAVVEGASFSLSNASGLYESDGAPASVGGSIVFAAVDAIVRDTTFEWVGAEAGAGAIYAGTVEAGEPGGSLTLEDVTMTGPSAGWTGGGIVTANADLVVRGLDIGIAYTTQTETNGGGAALYSELGNTADLQDVSITFSSAASGGALWAYGVDIIAEGVTIYQNYATDGAGIYLEYGSLTGALTMLDNPATDRGGAIFAADAEVTLTDSVIGRAANDASARVGGGVYLTGATLTATSTRFERLAATEAGGAIYGPTGDGGVAVTLTDVTFDDVEAADGGGLWLDGAELSIDGVVATDARATERGGFASLLGVTGTLTELRVDGARAPAGAALYTDAADLDLARARWCDNGDETTGSVLDLHGTITSRAGFAAGNVATDAVVRTDGDVSLHNEGFFDHAGVAVAVIGGRADVRNAMFVGNGTGVDGDVTLAYDLWLDNGTDVAGGSLDDTHVVGVDPGHAGDRAEACADEQVLWLTAESPARDAGDPAIEDAWGGRSDIGPFGGSAAEAYGAEGCDNDGDGAIAAACGGDDCDDTDPSRRPGAEDTPNDRFDSDCDGWDNAAWVEAWGCDTSGAGAAAWGVLGALLLRRRRATTRGAP